MERRRLSVGKEVGVVRFGGSRSRPRRAKVVRVEDWDGSHAPRCARVQVRYLDSGEEVAVALWRLVDIQQPAR